MFRLIALAVIVVLTVGSATATTHERNGGGAGSLKPDRDPNALWFKGGLMYPVQFH